MSYQKQFKPINLPLHSGFLGVCNGKAMSFSNSLNVVPSCCFGSIEHFIGSFHSNSVDYPHPLNNPSPIEF
jgi:hypothetical protein